MLLIYKDDHAYKMQKYQDLVVHTATYIANVTSFYSSLDVLFHLMYYMQLYMKERCTVFVYNTVHMARSWHYTLYAVIFVTKEYYGFQEYCDVPCL